MSFTRQTQEIRATAEKLLDEGYTTVLGFAEGGLEGQAVPLFATTPEEVQRLVWNDRCVPPLAAYLPGAAGIAAAGEKLALVAKPCDTRAVVNLLVENQLAREDVHIIGIQCAGMKDAAGEALLACTECTVRTPPVYDTLIAADALPVAQEANAEEAFDLARFQGEMDKCILCFSCRQACYGCYCDTCFMDRGVPSWQASNPDFGAKMVYHLGRAMHLAGRCVGCGACENTCASGVDVRYLIREASRFVQDEYGFAAGLDAEAPPAMLTYKMEDREVGFWEGEGHG